MDVKVSREQQSRHQLEIGNGNITSLKRKEDEVVEEAKHIPWTLLASLRQRVGILTLLSWKIRGNFSSPALTQQSLVREEWEDL